MCAVKVKQVKKQTFIDLSTQDLLEEQFIEEFKNFAQDNAAFLEGSAVSLLLSEDSKDRVSSDDKDFAKVLKQIQKELNKRNVSLKKLSSDGELLQNPEKPEGSLEQIAISPKGEVPFSHPELEQFSPAPVGANSLYIKSNLRSGQSVRHRGDVFIFGDVNDSAEIIASGDIVVWGRLRGVVHAGAEGNDNAMIAALEISSGQIRISDKFVSLSAAPKRHNKKAGFATEIAKIQHGEIVITQGL